MLVLKQKWKKNNS